MGAKPGDEFRQGELVMLRANVFEDIGSDQRTDFTAQLERPTCCQPANEPGAVTIAAASGVGNMINWEDADGRFLAVVINVGAVLAMRNDQQFDLMTQIV